MNWREHIDEAERLAALAGDELGGNDVAREISMLNITLLALVHTKLAELNR